MSEVCDQEKRNLPLKCIEDGLRDVGHRKSNDRALQLGSRRSFNPKESAGVQKVVCADIDESSDVNQNRGERSKQVQLPEHSEHDQRSDARDHLCAVPKGSL